MSEAILERLRQFQTIPYRRGMDHQAWMLVRLAARMAELEMLLETAQARQEESKDA